jgi:hypothetical protein
MGTVGYLGQDMAMEGLIQMQKNGFILDFFFIRIWLDVRCSVQFRFLF